jgi:GMP synthase (glutamine-hydrolysing)
LESLPSLKNCLLGEVIMLVIVQNDPEVPPGLLLDVVRKKEISFRILHLFSGEDLGALENVRGMVVLGGRMSVEDVSEFPYLQQVKEQIRGAVKRQIPFLGICLGGQLLAEVLGTRVHLEKRGERGCRQIYLTAAGAGDRLFRGMLKPFISFQWHSDSFDLPPGAVHLASSDVCCCQAFRFGAAAYGIQFHPEVTREIVLSWSANGDDTQTNLLDAFTAVEEAYPEASLTLFGSFLEML